MHVTRCHAVTEELDATTRGSLRQLRSGGGKFSDSKNGVLGTLEDTSVHGVLSWDELNEGVDTTRVGASQDFVGHGIGDGIVVDVAVLVKHLLELSADEEAVDRLVLLDATPDDLLLAVGALRLVVLGIKVLSGVTSASLLSLGLVLGLPAAVLEGSGGSCKSSKSEFHCIDS